MSGTPETTNLLLMLLVIATALTPVLLIAGAVALMVAYRRTSARVERELAPLMAEVRATLAEVQHISASVRRRVDEVDRGVTAFQHKTAQLSDSIKTAVGGTLGRVLSVLGPRPSRRAS
jgi:hypothetical protein